MRMRLCYPGYRYCGPGCTGPGKPVNVVDECCRQHDLCYEMGYPKRYCDEYFQFCIYPYINSHTKMGREAAFFSNMIKMRKFFF